MSESEIIAYVAGVLTIPALQYVGWPYLKRYLGIKGKKGKKSKNSDGGNSHNGSGKHVHYHIHIDDEEKEGGK